MDRRTLPLTASILQRQRRVKQALLACTYKEIKDMDTLSVKASVDEKQFEWLPSKQALLLRKEEDERRAERAAFKNQELTHEEMEAEYRKRERELKQFQEEIGRYKRGRKVAPLELMQECAEKKTLWNEAQRIWGKTKEKLRMKQEYLIKKAAFENASRDTQMYGGIAPLLLRRDYRVRENIYLAAKKKYESM